MINDTPSVDEALARRQHAATTNEYALIQLSPRRFAVGRRTLHVGRIGLYADGPSRPLVYLVDWTGYELVEGCESLTWAFAVRALYRLTRGEDPKS